jgi:hypothetical protein
MTVDGGKTMTTVDSVETMKQLDVETEQVFIIFFKKRREQCGMILVV